MRYEWSDGNHKTDVIMNRNSGRLPTIYSAIAESLARGAKIINLTIAESKIQAAEIIHSATVAEFKKIRS